MEGAETEAKTNSAADGDAPVQPAGIVTPQSCPSCGNTAGFNQNMPMLPIAAYVYAVGRIEPRFPRLSVEKEFAQAIGRELESEQMPERIVDLLYRHSRLPPPPGRSGGGKPSSSTTPSGAVAFGVLRFGIPSTNGSSCSRAIVYARRSSATGW